MQVGISTYWFDKRAGYQLTVKLYVAPLINDDKCISPAGVDIPFEQ